MALAIILAALIVIFILLRHHVGVPFLSMIAGLAVYETFGAGFASTVAQWIPAINEGLANQIIYGVLVAGVPLVLYLRVGRSGLFGILRIIESTILALLMTVLMSDIIASYFPLDRYSSEILGWINGVRGFLMMGGIIMAYVDVFLYHSSRLA
jgi:hypothetical protein